jgi:uncharacterized protein (TIGR02246 family)
VPPFSTSDGIGLLSTIWRRLGPKLATREANSVWRKTSIGEASVALQEQGLFMIEEEISQLAEDLDSAWNEDNAAKAASYWRADGLNISPMGDVFEGRPAIQADLEANLKGFLRGSKHALRIDRTTLISRDVAVADGTATISSVLGPDGNELGPWRSNFTMICVKQDGHTWAIAQMRAFTFLSR